MGLDRSTVLITGGASRLGSAIARRLAMRRCALLLHCCSTPAGRVEEVTKELLELGAQSVEWFRSDFASLAGIESLLMWLAERPSPFALVNNAGVWLRKPIAETSWDDWTRVLAINTISPALLAAALTARGVCKVVNISDIAWEKAWKQSAAYSASKSALTAFTRSAAVELGRSAQLNAVAPGLISVPAGEEEIFEPVRRRVPAGRPGTADEVARTVEFLLDAPDYISGQVLAVDGGLSAR